MKQVGALLTCLLLGIGLAVGQTQSRETEEKSLGEIARQLRAKKGKPTGARVYTNDDLARMGRAPVSVVGGATAAAVETRPAETPAAEKPAAAAETAPGEKKDEQYWRGKFAEVRNKIATAERELDLLQRELNLERVQYSQDPNEALRQQYLGQQAGGRIAELQQKIQEKQAEIERHRQEQINLENELRRAGGNPGWARP